MKSSQHLNATIRLPVIVRLHHFPITYCLSPPCLPSITFPSSLSYTPVSPLAFVLLFRTQQPQPRSETPSFSNLFPGTTCGLHGDGARVVAGGWCMGIGVGLDESPISAAIASWSPWESDIPWCTALRTITKD